MDTLNLKPKAYTALTLESKPQSIDPKS